MVEALYDVDVITSCLFQFFLQRFTLQSASFPLRDICVVTSPGESDKGFNKMNFSEVLGCFYLYF